MLYCCIHSLGQQMQNTAGDVDLQNIQSLALCEANNFHDILKGSKPRSWSSC